LNWWKNASRNMFYHCWGILSLQQVWIYGCLMEPMMFKFLLLLSFLERTKNQNKLLLNYLKHQRLHYIH
jgi:hypothetical protein